MQLDLSYTGHDLAILNLVANGNVPDFVRQHRLPLVQRDGTYYWLGCTRMGALCSPESHVALGLNTPPCCREHLRRMAKWVATRLNEAQVPYWVDFGTLLGIIRQGDIIPWDTDVDISVKSKSFDDIWSLRFHGARQGYRFIQLPGQSAHGLPIIRILCVDNFDDTDVLNSCPLYVDIYPFDETSLGTLGVVSIASDYFPKRFVEPTETFLHWGVQFQIPNNVEAFLTHRYGSEWRKPSYVGWRTDWKDLAVIRAEEDKRQIASSLTHRQMQQLQTLTLRR
jgi:hypothetical protein